MGSIKVLVLPSDKRFIDSPDTGWPECICSRCGIVIEESECPIRVWPDDFSKESWEYRYHIKCLEV
jgi:hypothetical protein